MALVLYLAFLGYDSAMISSGLMGYMAVKGQGLFGLWTTTVDNNDGGQLALFAHMMTLEITGDLRQMVTPPRV